MADSLASQGKVELNGERLLTSRRSIRAFTEETVPDELLWRVFELCRYAPTSKNSQSYNYVVIRDPAKLHWLSLLRGANTAPLAKAKAAVAVVSDPAKSRRHLQDGVIAAYHFVLAAWCYGLGTCWIAALDRDDVKKELDIPLEHTIATITPLGYPAERPEPPERRPKEAMVRFVK